MIVIYRLAVPEDLSWIIDFDHIAARPDLARQNFICHAIETHSCIVALNNEILIGYMVLNYTFYSCGFVAMLHVGMNYRRQRVGQGLLEVAEKSCLTPKLFTSTNLSNLPMQSLLGKQGFIISGIVHNLDEGDPEIIYFKRIQ